MRSLRKLVVVGATIALSAILVPSVLAGSPHGRALHIAKECSEYTRLAGGFCTITSSNVKAIPIGTKVGYERALGTESTVLETDITLDPPGAGDVAFGHVHLDLVAGIGLATFTGGTGKFAGFTASVVVTP